MINTHKIFNELRETMEPDAAEKIIEVIGSVFDEIKNSVTKTEFHELKEVVRDLALAQRSTEDSVQKLSHNVQQMAGQLSQLTERVETLATRMDQLTERVDTLAIRMDQLTERVDSLATKMDQLTERVDTLAVRMDQLTEKVDQLSSNVQDIVRESKIATEERKEIWRQIGGMSHTIGYFLEDKSYPVLPHLLERDHSIIIQDKLKRGFLEIPKNKFVEINIWGKGTRLGMQVEIIGEAKTQLKKKDVDKLLMTVKAVENYIRAQIVPVCVTFQTSPHVQKYAKEKGVIVYFSYELQ